jgi:hypothetical protein
MPAALAQIPSFIFGGNAPAKTPQEAARNRAVYEQIAARLGTAPQNVGQGLSAVGQAFLGRAMMDRANAGEEAGRASAAKLASGLADGADMAELQGVLADPWAMESPGTSLVAQTLLKRNMDQSDPGYQADLAYKQAQTAALQAKPANTAPDIVELFDEATGQPYKAQWNATTGQYEKVGGTKARSDGMVITTNPDGTTTVSMNGDPKLTEGQSKDGFYYIRGAGANENLEANEASLTSLGDTMANGVPLIGNYFTSDGFKNANRDGKEFLAAILRKDSGGAITPDEWSYYGPMYLPAPGDNPEQLANKREARTRAMEALKAVSGPAKLVIDEYERSRNPPAVAEQPAVPVPAGAAPAPADMPEGVTEEDIQHTMQVHGLSREEVLKRLTNAA